MEVVVLPLILVPFLDVWLNAVEECVVGFEGYRSWCLGDLGREGDGKRFLSWGLWLIEIANIRFGDFREFTF